VAVKWLTLTHSHTHTITHSHTHTLTHSHTHSHTLSHTRTFTQLVSSLAGDTFDVAVKRHIPVSSWVRWDEQVPLLYNDLYQ